MRLICLYLYGMYIFIYIYIDVCVCARVFNNLNMLDLFEMLVCVCLFFVCLFVCLFVFLFCLFSYSGLTT